MRTEPVDPSLHDGLARLAGTLLTEETTDSAMELVAELARTSIGKADAVGVTLMNDGEVYTANYSDEQARAIDDIQYQHSQGPCLEAMVEGREIHLASMADERRWPAFVEAAREHGMAAILCLPLDAKGRMVGALNLYSATPGAFSDDELEIARAFARQASILLANLSDYAEANALNDHLREALQTRDLIGQAKGVIMATRRCSADEAFEELRRRSQDANVKLREVAKQVVDELLGP